jgi:uncharacterized protein (TIGR02145 family)
MKKRFKTLTIILITTLFLGCSKNDNSPSDSTVTDADGNVYNTIKIGNQIWMLENLKTTKYNDGTPITKYTLETFGSNWGSIDNQVALYQWADTSDLNNVVEAELPFDFYGAMYNHFAIESGKLAPKGWRIPSEADFKQLESFLASKGHTGNEATVLKTETGWLTSSENGTNLYGFNGLPNGYVHAFGGPTFAEGICTWVTTNISGNSLPSLKRKMVALRNNGAIEFQDNAIQIGAAVRCIKN